MKQTKILIVDDHPIVRHGLRELIGSEEDLTVCGEAGSYEEALALADDLKPEFAIVDLKLGAKSGLQLIKELKARDPSLPILVLSIYNDSIFVERALHAGAQGYIVKEEAPGIVVEAIREILKGDIYVCRAMVPKLLAKVTKGRLRPTLSNSVDRLTDRELEVFELIGKGIGTRDIAKTLNISLSTVETHRAKIKEKLDIASSLELVRFATTWSFFQT